MTTRTQSKVTDPISVARYAEQVMKSRAMLDNLAEFFDTMPAPDDNGWLSGIDYGFLGSLDQIHTHLVIAIETADEMCE